MKSRCKRAAGRRMRRLDVAASKLRGDQCTAQGLIKRLNRGGGCCCCCLESLNASMLSSLVLVCRAN